MDEDELDEFEQAEEAERAWRQAESDGEYQDRLEAEAEARGRAAERERVRAVVEALQGEGGPDGLSSHEVDHGWAIALHELLRRLEEG